MTKEAFIAAIDLMDALNIEGMIRFQAGHFSIDCGKNADLIYEALAKEDYPVRYDGTWIY